MPVAPKMVIEVASVLGEATMVTMLDVDVVDV